MFRFVYIIPLHILYLDDMLCSLRGTAFVNFCPGGHVTLPRAATIGTERCFVPPPTHQPDDCLSPPASVAAGCLRPDSGRLGSETAPAGACAGLPSGPGCGRGRFWRGLGAGARVVARQGGSGLGGGRGAAAAAAFVTKESSAGRAVQGAHPREVGVGGARAAPAAGFFLDFLPPTLGGSLPGRFRCRDAAVQPAARVRPRHVRSISPPQPGTPRLEMPRRGGGLFL